MQQPTPPPPPPVPKPLNSNTNSKTQLKPTPKTLLTLLRLRKTDEAYNLYAVSPALPDSTSLSRLVSQLSYQNTPSSLSRAHSILLRLQSLRRLHLLDSNALSLLTVSLSKSHLPSALSIITYMLSSHSLPHVKAWSAVLSRLSSSPDPDSPLLAIRLFHSILSRVRSSPIPTDGTPDTGAYNAVLNAASNLGHLDTFASLFHQMREFNLVPDVLTYNILLKMCARAGRKDLLGFVLEEILRRHIEPCSTTLHSLVAGYVGFGDLHMAEAVVQAMREGRSDLCAVVRNSTVDPFVPDGGPLKEMVNPKPEEAAPLLLKKYAPDCRLYTILMKGYMNKGRLDDVVRMVRAMKKEPDPRSHPDHVTYTTVISALSNAGEMQQAERVLADMIGSGISPNRVTYNVLLKGYCQQLQLDKAKEMIREMSTEAGIEPNEVSYNILIDGCVLKDDSTGALHYFNEMRERGIAPSKVSYTTLMKAFALSGQPKLAHKVFDEMSRDGRVKVDRVAWNMLVEGYCRVGLIEEAKRVVDRMRENGFRPDVATYGSLANGIAVARRPGEALILWNEVKERCSEEEPPFKPDEGLLDALADVCVRAAFFKKALEIVACMEDNGISPNKTKYKRIYVEMHSRMFTSKHASRARQQRRSDRKRAAEAFKFWLGLPNSYYGSEWRIEPIYGDGD